MDKTSHTPASPQAVPAPYQHRLRATADAMLRAVESMELPKTYAQVAAAARALMAISRLMDRLYAEPKSATKSQTTPRTVTTVPVPHESGAIPFTNRKMRRLAEATLRRTG